jgi:hypothetical protein
MDSEQVGVWLLTVSIEMFHGTARRCEVHGIGPSRANQGREVGGGGLPRNAFLIVGGFPWFGCRSRFGSFVESRFKK